jgi:5-methylcytosine-specific restriction enzyme A
VFKSPDRRIRQRSRFHESPAWRELRALKLKHDPLCEECRRRGQLVQATAVHHVVPVKADPEKALEFGNLMSVCWACHNQLEPRRPSPGR